MGESQHVYATRDIESGAQDKVLSFEPFSKKDVQSKNDNGTNFVSRKGKEPHNQREAVIRPQKAGKIDFKSLTNRPRFPSARPWGAATGAPPSPPGRSRGREKSSRRSGKGERGHQQLYRLTVSNARPNPTIGIAYPQQKITPPKKVEADQGPAVGSYRFHVPSVPTRELKLQEEELSFARCFPEAAPRHISSNYTSQAAAACPNHGSKIRPLGSVPHENPGTKGLFPYLEFQANGGNLWPPPDKSYPGASNGLPAPKLSTPRLGPLSFQFPFSPLHSSATDPFQGEAHTQDYSDVPRATSQPSHGAFAFHSSSRDWKEEVLGNGSYDSVESRTYGLAPQPTPFLLPQAPGHLPSYKGRNEHSTDRDGALSPSGAIDQVPSTFQENQAVFPPGLHASGLSKPMGKRPTLSKDSVASPRILDAGSSLRRGALSVSLPQVHFQSQASNEPSAGSAPSGSVPFEKSLPTSVQAHPRLLQTWEGGKKTYSPLEQSSAVCPSPGGTQLPFGYPSALEQRQHVKKAWQHLHLASGMPGQNRIELSRKLSSQKLPFPLSTSEWDGSRKRPQSPTSYPSKALGTEERQYPAPQSCSSASSFCFEGSTEVETSKSKSFFFSVSPALSSIPSHHPSSPHIVLPPSALAPSPSGSPLPSPVPNLTSSCSSLSPTSSSPTSHSFEDEAALATSTCFHHQGHPKDGSKPFHAMELLGSSAAPYQMANPIKAFHQELLYKGISEDSHLQKPNTDASKRCPEGFESELPPPPYPYSSRHFLASSLSSTSLDQLDVFLTCKQCDQNFSNLSSFLEHRQFCSSHVVLQGQAKDTSRGAEVKKQHHVSPEPAKHTQSSLGMILPPDPHLQLLALNKTVDFLVDVEGKGESKDDPLKANQLSGLPGNFLPLNTSDLEIDDAKLDSLITEALNGLGYQSDNPEIDSSFIDVFADEELASVKVTSAGTPFKAKENLTLGKKAKHVAMDENTKMLNCCDNHPSGELAKSRTSKQRKERGTNWLSDLGEESLETVKSTELARNKVPEPTVYGGTERDAGTQLKIGKKNCRSSFLPMKQGGHTRSDVRQTENPDCASLVSELEPDGTHSVAGNTMRSKKDAKKRKLRSGSWSKELIHKIVQQKNKFHKLHTQNSKTVPLSLLTNRFLPETKDNKFSEYEYISESDDERVEYAKRHCRRKLGSRFSGRLRSSLSRRGQGRGGREKEKEPIRRSGPGRGREEPKRSAGKELERKDGVVTRTRRRSSQSSASSRQSTGVSSETSNSPQSTERGDSDTEREGERRRQLLQVSKSIGPLDVPQKETIRKSHRVCSGLSGEPDKVDPPKTQPADNVFQKDNPNIPPDKEGEALLQSSRKPRHPEATPGKGPETRRLCPEGSDQCNRRFCCNSEKPKVVSEDAGWQSEETGDPLCYQYAAGKGGLLKNHVEELAGSPSTGKQNIPSEESTSCEQVGIKGLKRQKELIVPVGCFGDNPVSTSGKGVSTLLDADSAFYDCKELSNSYGTPSLFSGPPTIEPSPNENVYLCQGDFDVPSFKEKHHDIMPCESDNAPSKVSSPLNFDSPSVFGEFPIAEFDANLYDSVASSKDSYIPFECANHQLGKIIPFDQQYSSFLSEKDWALMEEVSPVLPEDMPQIHRLSAEKPVPKRYPSEINPLSLSERLSDYNMHFVSGLSDDELEIKRLVTELESQLQANKLNMQASDEDQASVNHTSMEAKESTHEFLSLRLDQQQNGKGLFLMEAEYENATLLSTKTFSCENVASEKTLLPTLDAKYGSPNNPWPCAGSFSPLQSATDLILVGPFRSQGDRDKTAENLKDIEISAEADFEEIKDASARIMPDSCLEDLSNSTGVPDYPEHIIQSPDSIFPKSLEDSELNSHENLPLRPDVFPKLPSGEKTFDDTTELKSYGHEVPHLEPEVGLQDIDTLESDGNVSSSAQSQNPENHSPGKLESTTLFQNSKDEHLGKNEETGSQTVCQVLMLKAKADNGNTPHFDVLTFSKEMDGEVVFKSTTQEKTANPLQQLQLFVARTVKNNEEDLGISSFPAQHPIAHLPTGQSIPPEPEEEPVDKEQNEEVTSGPTLEKMRATLLKKTGKAAEQSVPAKLLSEPEKQAEHFDEWVSGVSKDLAPLNPAQYSNVAQQQHLKAECLEVNGHTARADGIALEHSNLSTPGNSEVASALREKRTQQSQVTGQAGGDQGEKTLAFRDCRKSPLSPGSSGKKTSQSALPAVLQIHMACCASWNKACCGDQELGTAKAHQVEEREEQLKHLQLNVSLAPNYSPESQTEDAHLLQRNGFSSRNNSGSAEGHDLEKQVSYYAEGSQAGFSQDVGFADQEKLLKADPGNATGSDFGGIPSEESTGQITAASQQVAFLACSRPSVPEKTAVPQQSPSEQKEGKGTLPFFPTSDAISHLPSDVPGTLAEDLNCDLMEPQKNIPLRYSSSICSGKVAPSSAKTDRRLNLQMHDCKSPSMLPLKSKKHSKEPSKHPADEDSGVFSVRDGPSGSQAASLRGILLNQLPPGIDSVELRGAVCNKNVSLTSKPQGGKDIGREPQEGSKDSSQPGFFEKDVDVQEVPVVILTKKADATSQFPLRGSSRGPQDRSNHLENEDSALNENMKKSSECMEQEGSKGQSLRNYAKTGQSKAKKRKGLQITCDICSISFRSKTGLMRHKAVKHQKKKDSVLLPDNNSAPLEKALKTSKVLPKKSIKSFMKEKSGSSDLSKAVGQSFPKSSRRQRKEPKGPIHGLCISKELNDLNVISSDITHEVQKTNEIRPTSSQGEKSDGSEIRSRKKTSTEKSIRVVSTKRSSRGVGGKTKEKSRQAKITSDKNEVTVSFLQDSEIPAVHGNATGSTDDHILATITEEPGSRSEEQANICLPLLPQPLTNKELENAGEKTPSAQRTAELQLLQNVESYREEGEDAELEQKEKTQERWSSRSMEEGENELNKKPASKEGLLEEMDCTTQNSPLVFLTCPNKLSPPCHPGTTSEKGSPKATSEKASGADAPYFVNPEPWRMEEQQPQNESPVDNAGEPDLPSLFDDDSTFSQLFPRNDQFARRKCTRVYGKRSKKPKPIAEIIAKPEGTPDIFTIRMASDLGETSSFCVTREDPCEYDTISIDDALMLNMCHGSKAMSGDVNSRCTQNTVLQVDTGEKQVADDLKNNSAFLCPKCPSGSLPCFQSWGNLEETAENNSADGTLHSSAVELAYGHSAVEDSPEPPGLEEEPYSAKQKPPSAFRTIDVEMLNMKFETRDICFCSTGEDRLSPTDDDCTLGFKPTSLLQVRPIKRKLEEGKPGKPRSDLNLKNKDKQYKCKVCFQWFLTLGELDFHKLTHNPSPPPTCYMCVQRKFSSREQLRDHLKEKHAKNKAGLWACGMCLKEISEVWMYNEHLREHATQFARKGQAQKSVLGLPGCFSEEDAAVTHFLNSIICRKPGKFSKQAGGGNGAPVGSESKGPKGFSGQDSVLHKDLLEIPLRTRPPRASLRAPPVPSPDPIPKVEGAQKSVPIHPECKDPSRDCHHCGKQFPKPFKLQRHLVVHSLQKIFLCHKCPMFYQETKELRSHLGQEHGIAEETDIKHTTLYACELCADVMHVIKKSFICSTCNYTFSKKGQYDRHMEKHLVGSSKTFRFRGVMRPGAFAKCRDKEAKEEAHVRADAPAAKRKKVSHPCNSPELALPVPLDGAQASQEDSQPLLSVGEVLSTATSLTVPPSAQTPMKAEGPGSDFSNLLVERGKSPLHHLLPSLPFEPQDEPSSPEHMAALSPETWAHGESLEDNPILPSGSPDALSVDLASITPKKTTAAQEKLPPAHLSEKYKGLGVPEKATLGRRVEHNVGTWETPYLEDLASKEPKLSPGSLRSAECKWSPEIQWGSRSNMNGPAPQDAVSKLHLPETGFHELPLKDKTTSSALNQPAKEIPSKNAIGGQASAENTRDVHCSPGSAEEVQKCSLPKGKAFPETDAAAHPRDGSSSTGAEEAELRSVRPVGGHLQGEAGSAQKNNPSDPNKFPERLAANRLASLHSKKPKEHKSSHRGSSASRENIEGDGSKKRKARIQDSVKGDNVRKVDWPTTEALALSPRRRDAHSNKVTPKLKVPVTDSQLRKLVLDQGFQKKVEICHANGELRHKKEILGGKALHPLLAKDPSASLPSSLSRRRAVHGAKLPSSHSYRTAESQTHLLNQLFGQKLTSFKIPLRRDTSE
ncbi:zinc finger protein 469 [Candoia aspera]|uniref:zinc finger protein 469 n=1 Tax=Candoia aspera TaxID=51853 RepID=UPI002FD84C54